MPTESTSRRGEVEKATVAVAWIAFVIVALAYIDFDSLPVRLLVWLGSAAVAIGVSFRRVEVSSEAVVLHHFLGIATRYPHDRITGVVVRDTSIGDARLRAVAPYLELIDGADTRLVSLAEYGSDAGRKNARRSGTWLAERLGVPLTIDGSAPNTDESAV